MLGQLGNGEGYMDKQQIKKGVFIGISAYIIWGFLPIYWKWLEVVTPDIVITHRIIWSFFFMLIYILVTKQWHAFIVETKRIFRNHKTSITVILASIMIGLNWLIFIWAVQNDRVVESSLGYYINPLMNVLLGVVFLQERLSKMQKVSLLLATIGVAIMAFNYQTFPWVALVLASSFALYGLLKKVVQLNATFSLMIETALLMPIALIYLLYHFGFSLGFNQATLTVDVLLIGSGIATAVPLLLFGMAVSHLTLSAIGFLQYLSPTVMLLLGTMLYKEPFTSIHAITFILIWISLILYMATVMQHEKKLQKNKS